MRYTILFASVVVIVALRTFAQAPATQPAQPMSEDQKIEALIKTVEQLKDATFIRNGKEHDCHAAAKHMRDKWEHGKDQIKTAKDFIEKAASNSLKSGKPYIIKFKDGREVESGAFLNEELKKLESANASGNR